MEKELNKVVVTLGDWSDDGHGKSDKVDVRVSCTVKEMQDAYKASCKLTGISFNDNEDFTGKDKKAIKHSICTEYEDNELSLDVIKIFNSFDCPWEKLEIDLDDVVYLDPDIFLNLLMWFISLSIKDFVWERDESAPIFNGWWNDELNVQLGYGLYN